MRAIGRFLLLTFAGTWGLWVLVLRVSGGRESSVATAVLALGGPVFLLGVFTPGLVAVALTALDRGRAGVAALLGRILRWHVGIRYYAFALLLVPVTKLGVAVLHRELTGVWPAFGETRPLVLIAATVLSTLGQAGEEVGWRGYLLPRIAERAGLAWASVIVGVIWATWHLPLFFASGADTNGQSFPLYLLEVTALSVILAWLYWRTGSLLLTMLMHSAFNNMKDIVPSAASGAGPVFSFGGTLVLRLTMLLLWATAALLLVRMRRASRVMDEPQSAVPLVAV